MELSARVYVLLFAFQLNNVSLLILQYTINSWYIKKLFANSISNN